MLAERIRLSLLHMGHIPHYLRKFGWKMLFRRCWIFLFRWRDVQGTLFALDARRNAKPPHPILSAPVNPEEARLLKPKVLIVAEQSIPQCMYYRVEQKVRMLEDAGYAVENCSWTDYLSCICRIQTATLVIFYRVPFTQEMQSLYAEAKRLGIKIGFDIDDLVFDIEEYSRNSNLLALPKDVQKSLLNGAHSYQQALAAADFSIASTPHLADFMRKYCKGPCYIIPNCICRAKGEAAKAEAFRFPLGLDGRTVIGYGSGTSTHNEDFKLCANAVLRIMRDFPDVIFVLHGLLELPEAFDEVNDRIIRIPFVPFTEYSAALARFDVNLIPLEGGLFNDCKSNIKYLEASRMSVPSVASPCAEFKSVISNGENGYIATDENEWYAALRRLVESAPLRRRMGDAARQTVMSRYDSEEVFRKCFTPLLDVQLPRERRERKRIMVVNVLYPPMSFGGATVIAENLVAGYAKTMDVCVFSMTMDVRTYPGYVHRYSNRGEMCFQLEKYPPQDPDENWSSQDVVLAFATIANAFKPDIVHFHSIQFLGVEMAQWCQSMNTPYVVTAHDAWWICPRQFMLDRNGKYCGQDENGVDMYKCIACAKSKDFFPRARIMHDILDKALVVVTPSDYQTGLYQKSGVRKELVVTNRNGIFVPGLVAPHKLHTTLTFAYIGGRCDHKGYFFLKEIASMLHGDFKLKLVDVNLKFGQCSIDAKEWPKNANVETVPPFDHHNMDSFYNSFDVLLFPSCWKESFGLTVREALARNVWVISTDAGGDIGYDLKDGVNGDLVKMFDAKAFATAMQRLIDHPEKLNDYVNPLRGKITTHAAQVDDMLQILKARGFSVAR